MTLPSLGSYSLSVSTALYSFWLLPQILHNFRHNTLIHMSFAMHALITVGCALDFNYGLGAHMPTRYLWVACLSLTLLTIQHLQWFQQRHKACRPAQFWLLTITLSCLIGLSALTSFYSWSIPAKYVLTMGWLANGSFLLYPLPQIIKQHHNQCAIGVSLGFIVLGLILNTLDLITAYALAWPTPSYIGPIALMICQLTLLAQHLCYHPKKINHHEKTSPHHC